MYVVILVSTLPFIPTKKLLGYGTIATHDVQNCFVCLCMLRRPGWGVRIIGYEM